MTDEEKRLFQLILGLTEGGKTNISPEPLKVQEMLDSRTGTLYILSDRDKKHRRFGKIIGEFEFRDSDGMMVMASLYVDEQGDLYELDIFKAGFTHIQKVPSSSP